MANAPIAALQHEKDRHKKDATIPRSCVKPAAGRRAMAVVDQLGRRVMSKRYDKLRKAALAKDFASAEQDRIKAAKEFKRLKAKANRQKLNK